MVSFNVYKSTAAGIYVEGVCLISDEKPVAGIANGSILFAVDPSDGGMIRYMFNQSSASWVETTCPCSGGGSGGSGSGGGANTLVVNLSFDEDTGVYTADKTAEEMLAADGVFFVTGGEGHTVKYVCTICFYSSDDGYIFYTPPDAGITLYADNADDYPASEGGGILG